MANVKHQEQTMILSSTRTPPTITKVDCLETVATVDRNQIKSIQFTRVYTIVANVYSYVTRQLENTYVDLSKILTATSLCLLFDPYHE